MMALETIKKSLYVICVEFRQLIGTITFGQINIVQIHWISKSFLIFGVVCLEG